MAIIIHETIFSIIFKVLFTILSLCLIQFLYNNKFSKYHKTSNAIYLIGYILLIFGVLLIGIVPSIVHFILMSFAIIHFILASFVASTVEFKFFVYQLYNKQYKEVYEKVHEIIKEDKKKKRK